MFKPISILLKVLPDKVEEKTEGGIILAQTTLDAHERAGVTGTIVEIGADVDKELLPVGARILHVKYAGVLHKETDGTDYRYMKDEDVIAVEGVAHA